MKQTIIFSLTLMGLLNLWQFFSSYQQRAAAFAPAWAQTASHTSDTAPVTAAAHSLVPAAQPSTGTPVADTASVPAAPTTGTPGPPDDVAAVAAKLQAAGLKPDFAANYLAVQAKTGTPWQLLAAVHKIETNQRGDTAITSYAGAEGPMQFMPATFRAYAVDGDGNGTAQITDVDDAISTAGRYLAAGGANHGQYSTALYHYNHSWTYVNNVLAIAHKLGLK